jgi:F0F1-type ATP synthase gamma subunit
MFLNPNIRKKLILKQKYHNDMKNNKFVPDIIDDKIYLQQDDKKDIEYKNIIIVGEKATKDLEDNDNIEISLPKKMVKKISSEVEELKKLSKEIFTDSDDEEVEEVEEVITDDKEEKSNDEEVVEVITDDKEVKSNDEEEVEEEKELLDGGNNSNIKKIVVNSFF